MVVGLKAQSTPTVLSYDGKLSIINTKWFINLLFLLLLTCQEVVTRWVGGERLIVGSFFCYYCWDLFGLVSRALGFSQKLNFHFLLIQKVCVKISSTFIIWKTSQGKNSKSEKVKRIESFSTWYDKRNGIRLFCWGCPNTW